MIGFATAVTEPEAYRRYAEPGIRLAAEPRSPVLAFAAVESMSRSLNLLLEAASRVDGLEALVLVHPYTEIADPDLCGKVRAALADPEVAMAGCLGGTGTGTMAWWEGAVSSGNVTHRYVEHGGGELPGASWVGHHGPPGRVETLDGSLLALSPWAVRTLRFDESIRQPYGQDVDLCWQARAAGRAIVTMDFRVVLHHPLEIVTDLNLWIEAHMRLARKWDGRPESGSTTEQEARRAEAERDAARALAYATYLICDAQVLERRRALEQLTESRSWRMTASLRRINHGRRTTARRLRSAFRRR